jgi:hypothetical protein
MLLYGLVILLWLRVDPGSFHIQRFRQNSFGMTFAAQKEMKKMALHVSSSAFAEGQSIPEKYTCEGPNVSPPLSGAGPL